MSLCLVISLASVGTAQSAADHIALGDREYAALDAKAALSHYEAAAAADPESYAALWKSSRSAMDLSMAERDESRRDSLYKVAEKYARRAIAVSPRDAEGHFSLARALGKEALAQSPRARIRYAKDIRNGALECLRLNPRHAGCLHVMGMWNAEVMRLNGITRMIARNFLGGGVFGSASWDEAIRYMEAAVAEEPRRIIHRVDLADIYRDRGMTEKARAEYEAALRLPATDYGDRSNKAQAEAGLRKL